MLDRYKTINWKEIRPSNEKEYFTEYIWYNHFVHSYVSKHCIINNQTKQFHQYHSNDITNIRDKVKRINL